MKKQKSGGGMGGMLGKMASKFMPGIGGAPAEQKNAMVEQLYSQGKLPQARSSEDSKQKRAKRKAERKRRKKGRRR